MYQIGAAMIGNCWRDRFLDGSLFPGRIFIDDGSSKLSGSRNQINDVEIGLQSRVDSTASVEC